MSPANVVESTTVIRSDHVLVGHGTAGRRFVPDLNRSGIPFRSLHSHERAPGGEGREAAEVPIDCHEVFDPVRKTDRSDAGIVHLWSDHVASVEQRKESIKVFFTFREKPQSWRLGPGAYLVYGLHSSRWWIVDPRVRHHGVELVNARPWDRPCKRSLGKFADSGLRGLMKR